MGLNGDRPVLFDPENDHSEFEQNRTHRISVPMVEFVGGQGDANSPVTAGRYGGQMLDGRVHGLSNVDIDLSRIEWLALAVTAFPLTGLALCLDPKILMFIRS